MNKIILTQNHLTDELFVNDVKHILVTEADLEKLVIKIEKLREEKDLIKWGLFQLLGLLGLTNDEKTEVKPGILNQDENILKHLMKRGADLFWTFTQTGMPGAIGRRATDKVKEDFAFVDKILPLLGEEKQEPLPIEEKQEGN